MARSRARRRPRASPARCSSAVTVGTATAPEGLGEEMEGAYFTNHYAPDVPWPNAQKFVKKYNEKFKRVPTSLAAMGYDAAGVLADAIKRAKDDTPQGIRDAIAETKGFAGRDRQHHDQRRAQRRQAGRHRADQGQEVQVPLRRIGRQAAGAAPARAADSAAPAAPPHPASAAPSARLRRARAAARLHRRSNREPRASSERSQ
jgi:hypothetical protein